jgi:hypothetical protein
MSQEDVAGFLKKHNGSWFGSRDISKHLNISIGSVQSNLRKLRKSDMVLHKRDISIPNLLLYSYKEIKGETLLRFPKKFSRKKKPKPEKKKKFREVVIVGYVCKKCPNVKFISKRLMNKHLLETHFHDLVKAVHIKKLKSW